MKLLTDDLLSTNMWQPLINLFKSFINYFWAYLTFIPLAVIALLFFFNYYRLRKGLNEEDIDKIKSAKRYINISIISLFVFLVIFAIVAIIFFAF